MGGVVGGSESQTIGYRYYMTLQMGLGRGPVDELVHIKVGDKMAWPYRDEESTPYDTTITGDANRYIDAPELFGGDSAEGGIQGDFFVRMGGPTQIYPSDIKGWIGTDVPDFRGVVTAVFDGLIASFNPYPKSWSFRIRRALTGWDGAVWQPSLAVIPLMDMNGNQIKAMNPAHILYECATNRQWGRGLARSRLNEASWLAAAQQLKNEHLGLCIAWKRQDKLSNFVQQVIDHIGGAIYTDRETGLLTLKLIRDDYDIATLPSFDYSSGLLSVEVSETASLTEAVGEVIVNYHDPVSNEDMQTRLQNLAVIQVSEGLNSVTMNYPGIPIQTLAARVGQRDLKAMSAGGNRYSLKLDRRAWRIYPGAAFKISAPDKGLANVVLRAGKVSFGPPTSTAISVEATIDVFGLPDNAFVAAESPGWTPPNKTPQVIDNRIVREATWQELVRKMSPADLAYLTDTSAILITAAARGSQFMLSYDISTKASGETAFVKRGSQTFVAMALCSVAVGYYDAAITFNNLENGNLLSAGTVFQIDEEIMQVESITLSSDGVSGSLTVKRGCVDTVPKTHLLGAKIFFIGNTFGSDGREYAPGETVSVKLLSKTSSGTLAPPLAPVDSVVMTARQAAPYPPGNVRVNGTVCQSLSPIVGNFTVAWAHRDRKLQADQVIGHLEGNIGPEPGVTYEIRFYNGATLLRTIAGIAGTSVSFGPSDTDLVGSMTVRLWAVRGSIYSTQFHEFALTRSLT